MEDTNIHDVWLLLGRMDAKLDRVVDDAEGQDKRIKSLEKSRTYAHGFSACVGALVSFAVMWFKGH